jgi:hypothetical protein
MSSLEPAEQDTAMRFPPFQQTLVAGVLNRENHFFEA